MSKTVLTALTFSQQVQTLAQEMEDTLLSTLVVVCDRHSVPYEDVCRFVVDGQRVNLITPQLKDKLQAECEFRGLLRSTKRPAALDVLFG